MQELHYDHLEAFVNAFVFKNRRDRWVSILTKHKSKNYSLSSKLYDHINRDFWIRNDKLDNIVPSDTKGVFYDFRDPPTEISFKEAKEIGDGHDAIFSIKAGEFAVFFFHEMENYVLRKNT